MRPNLLLGFLSALLFLLTLTPVIAQECTPTTSDPEVDVGGVYYIDNDWCQPTCMFSIWIYEEANGIEGLQRGDEVKDDTCNGQIESDATWCLLLPAALQGRRRKGEPAVGGVALTGLALAGGTLAAVPTAEAC